jgi:hypothetical protein
LNGAICRRVRLKRLAGLIKKHNGGGFGICADRNAPMLATANSKLSSKGRPEDIPAAFTSTSAPHCRYVAAYRQFLPYKTAAA